MTWQNIVLSIGAIVFIIALVPALRAPHKPPVKTSSLYALVLAAFSVVDASFHVYVAAGFTLANAIQWLVLAGQGRREAKP